MKPLKTVQAPNEQDTTNNKANALTRENLEVLVRRRALLKAAKELTDLQALDVQAALEDGESRTIKTAQGVTLGKVLKTSPKPTATPDGMEVVLGSCREEELEFSINDMDAAVAVLMETAPHLLDVAPTKAALERQTHEALEHWKVTGEAPLGWRVFTPAGHLSVRPDKALVQTLHEQLDTLEVAALEAGMRMGA